MAFIRMKKVHEEEEELRDILTAYMHKNPMTMSNLALEVGLNPTTTERFLTGGPVRVNIKTLLIVRKFVTERGLK